VCRFIQSAETRRDGAGARGPSAPSSLFERNVRTAVLASLSESCGCSSRLSTTPTAARTGRQDLIQPRDRSCEISSAGGLEAGRKKGGAARAVTAATDDDGSPGKRRQAVRWPLSLTQQQRVPGDRTSFSPGTGAVKSARQADSKRGVPLHSIRAVTAATDDDGSPGKRRQAVRWPLSLTGRTFKNSQRFSPGTGAVKSARQADSKRGVPLHSIRGNETRRDWRGRESCGEKKAVQLER
jgi:hypothetical protein